MLEEWPARTWHSGALRDLISHHPHVNTSKGWALRGSQRFMNLDMMIFVHIIMLAYLVGGNLFVLKLVSLYERVLYVAFARVFETCKI